MYIQKKTVLPCGSPDGNCQQNCFAKFYCSGGCAANSYNFHGNINDAYDVGCEMQKKRIECAIMIRAAMAED